MKILKYQYVCSLLLLRFHIAKARETASARSAAITAYQVDSPEFGSCRLKGINSASSNFKFYASISAEGSTLNQVCGRCIKISCIDSTDKLCKSKSSVIAYVLDLCRGCKAGTMQTSAAVISSLGVSASTSAQETVSYKFVACPSNFLSGDIKACLMEGASSSYIPLQVLNSKQIIKEATISKRKATLSKDSFLFSVTPEQQQSSSDDWFKNVDVSLLGENGENLTTRFSFSSKSGCATSNVQFSEDTFTAEGSDNTSGESEGESHVGAIVGAVIGSIVALLVIAAVIVLLRRRRGTRSTKGDQELGESTAQHVASRVIPTRGTTGSLDDSAINSPHGGIYSHASTPGVRGNAIPILSQSGSSHSRYFPNSSQGPAKSQDTNHEVNNKTSDTREQEIDRDIVQTDENGGQTSAESSPVSQSQFRQSLFDANRSYDSMAYRSSHLYGSNLSSPRQSLNIAHEPTQTDHDIPSEMRDTYTESRSSFDIDFAREEGSTEEPQDDDILDIQAAEIIAHNQPGATPRTFELEEDTNVTTISPRDRSESPEPGSLSQSEQPEPYDYKSPSFNFIDPRNDIVTSSQHTNLGHENHIQSPPAAPFDMVHDESRQSIERPSDLSRSQTNALNSSGGYRRESLNLLGYPYAKRNTSRKQHPFSG